MRAAAAATAAAAAAVIIDTRCSSAQGRSRVSLSGSQRLVAPPLDSFGASPSTTTTSGDALAASAASLETTSTDSAFHSLKIDRLSPVRAPSRSAADRSDDVARAARRRSLCLLPTRTTTTTAAAAAALSARAQIHIKRLFADADLSDGVSGDARADDSESDDSSDCDDADDSAAAAHAPPQRRRTSMYRFLAALRAIVAAIKSPTLRTRAR